MAGSRLSRYYKHLRRNGFGNEGQSSGNMRGRRRTTNKETLARGPGVNDVLALPIGILLCGVGLARTNHAKALSAAPHNWGYHITHEVCWSTLRAGNPPVRIRGGGREQSRSLLRHFSRG